MSDDPPVRMSSWRERFARWDTLSLRLFLFMWLALVVSHFAAYSVVRLVALPDPPPGVDGPSHRGFTPTFPSLPPGPSLEGGPGGGPGPGRSELKPKPPPGAAGDPPPASAPRDASRAPGPSARSGSPTLPIGAWMLDYGVRLLVIALAAWWASRWLALPMHRLVQAATTLGGTLSQGRDPPQLDAHAGTREVREAAGVFNRMAAQLHEQFEQRGLMIAAISHDLRTPLTRMRLRLETHAVDPALRERCAQDLREMNALVESVLDVFRPQSGDAPTGARLRIDLASLAQSAVDDVVEGGAAATFEGGFGIVRVDPQAVRRVLDNLIGNALRYAGSARVRVTAQDESVALQVDDDGPGIPESQLPRVLEPFARLDTSRSRATGGSGLGLYIANELAKRQGARLTLCNRPEGGLRAELRWAQ